MKIIENGHITNVAVFLSLVGMAVVEKYNNGILKKLDTSNFESEENLDKKNRG